ncbi:MAG: glycosyl hydrolase [Spirochaetota bacterium]
MDTRFKSPEARFRPAPFWSWNADLDEKELTRQIKDMASKGIGGYFMHSRVGLITPYLGKKWHSCIRACVDAAKATGTDAWLYDEDKWPSGFAGGIVPEMGKDYRLKVLMLTADEKREAAVRPGEPSQSPMFSEDTSDDEAITSVSYEGKNFRIVKHIMPLGDAWFNGASYVDMMNPKVIEKFLEVTIDGYKKEVGAHFGKEIPGIFTDEPCYTHFGKYRGCLPWTEGLPAFFQKLKGYDILPHIASLFFPEGDHKKIRFDFFDTATRLFLEAFGKQYHKKCRENNLIFTGHYMAEDTLESQTQWIGAAMPMYEYMDWPGIDKLARHVEQTVTVKQVSSASEQLGKERTFCEVFGINGQHFDFKGRRWIHNWEAALGVNFVNHHLALYTMMGERKRDYPPNFFYQQAYWDHEKGLSDYFGRLNYMLTRGKRNIDTLMLHPIGSMWSSFEPRSYADPSSHEAAVFTQAKVRYDGAFKALTDRFLSRRLDFHYGDEIIMENHAHVDGKRFVIGKFSYDNVVVPPSLTWRTKTLDLIQKFSENGGTLVFVAPTPVLIDAERPLDCAKEFPGAKIVSSPDEAIAYLRTKKEYIGIENTKLSRETEEIFIHERTLDDGRTLIFLTNTHETKIIDARITIPYVGAVEELSCESGAVSALSVTVENGKMRIDRTFHGGDYLMIAVDTKKKPVQYDNAAVSQSARGHDPLFSIRGEAFAYNAVSLSSWKGALAEDNVLRIDRLSLWLNGEHVLDDKPMHKAWDEHFYKAADGTPFAAEYRFSVIDMPKGTVRAVIEMAHNLSSISLNGTAIKPDGKLWHNDPAFRTVDISKAVAKGENVLRIEGKKLNNITRTACHRRVKEDEFPYNNNEVEAVYIIGDFGVDNWENRKFSIAKKPPVSMNDITSAGFPFYAGSVSCTAKASFKKKPAEAYIELSDVHTPSAEIRVNGKKAGVLLWQPYRLDVTKLLKTGVNSIEVIFTTDLQNLMGPNTMPNGLPKGVGPGSFREEHVWSEELLLLRRGIGGVRLLYR